MATQMIKLASKECVTLAFDFLTVKKMIEKDKLDEIEILMSSAKEIIEDELRYVACLSQDLDFDPDEHSRVVMYQDTLIYVIDTASLSRKQQLPFWLVLSCIKIQERFIKELGKPFRGAIGFGPNLVTKEGGVFGKSLLDALEYIEGANKLDTVGILISKETIRQMGLWTKIDSPEAPALGDLQFLYLENHLVVLFQESFVAPVSRPDEIETLVQKLCDAGCNQKKRKATKRLYQQFSKQHELFNSKFVRFREAFLRKEPTPTAGRFVGEFLREHPELLQHPPKFPVHQNLCKRFSLKFRKCARKHW